MTQSSEDVLRPLVAEAVRAALANLSPRETSGSGRQSITGAQHARADSGIETVRLSDDRDLDAFVRRVVTLCENPRTRAQIVAGQLRFSLGPSPAPAGVFRGNDARRVDRGAVTERTVVEAAQRGQRLLIGRRAILTPLAKDKARTLDVHVEKER